MNAVKFLLVAMAAFAMASCGDPKPEPGPGPGPGPDPDPTPVITIVTQPVAPETLFAGEIPDGTHLTVEANLTDGKEGTSLSYQWHEDGKPVDGATDASYAIPATLVRGRYYYLCELSAEGAASVRTETVTVVVEPKPIPVPEIVITSQPAAPRETPVEGHISGYGVALRVEAHVTLIEDAVLLYQWYQDGTAIQFNSKENVYYLPTLTPAGSYDFFCELSVRGGELEPVRTETVTVVVSTYTISPGTEVIAGGMVWAGANVASTERTFDRDASIDGSYGGSYQFNRIKGWLSTSDADPEIWLWTYPPSGSNWHQDNDPCPAGWRVPWIQEWELLSANVAERYTEGYAQVWEMKDGTKLYLPAAGKRTGVRGSVEEVNTAGYYWSSKLAKCIHFDMNSGTVDLDSEIDSRTGCLVRCVRPKE